MIIYRDKKFIISKVYQILELLRFLIFSNTSDFTQYFIIHAIQLERINRYLQLINS